MSKRPIGIDLDSVEQTPAVLFSRRVRAACASAGIPATPSEMAAKTGLNRQTCHKYLNAGTSLEAIYAQYLFTVADRLGCSVRWLYTGKGSPGYVVAQTEEENEVVKTMRLVSKTAQAHILDAARGQHAKEKSYLTPSKSAQTAPSTDPAPARKKL